MSRGFTWMRKDEIILKQVKKNKSIVYGGQAIMAQIPDMFARPTADWDILSKKPKKSARQLEKTLDKNAGGNFYYTTPSKFHKGTWKVYNVGSDNKKGTKDDIGVADFTKMKKLRTIQIRGVKYAHASEIMKDKRASLKDKQFEFRHAKDKDDLERIKLTRKLWRK